MIIAETAFIQILLIVTFCGELVPAGQNVGRNIELSRIPPCRQVRNVIYTVPKGTGKS